MKEKNLDNKNFLMFQMKLIKRFVGMYGRHLDKGGQDELTMSFIMSYGQRIRNKHSLIV